MKYGMLFASLILASANTFAEESYSVGVQFVSTSFDRGGLLPFLSDIELEDDSDTGYGVYGQVNWSPWLGIKAGYLNSGEFSYSSEFYDEVGTGEFTSFYLAYSPRFQLAEQVQFGIAFGMANSEIDYSANSEVAHFTDDDYGFYASADIEYIFSNNMGIALEVGNIFSTVQDVDPSWFGANFSYKF